MEIAPQVSKERRKHLRQLWRFASSVPPIEPPNPWNLASIDGVMQPSLDRFYKAYKLGSLTGTFPVLLHKVAIYARTAKARLEDRLEEFEEKLKRYMEPRRSKPRDFMLDLLAIESSGLFKRVRYEAAHKKFIVTTEPITLNDSYDSYDFGEFDLSVRNDGTRLYLSAYARQPNTAKNRSDVTHPHVCDGDICFGDAGASARRAADDFRLYDLLLLARTALNSYNRSGAYVKLDMWYGPPDRCDDDEDRYTCDCCDEEVYEDDLRSCSLCDEQCCTGCRHRCRSCGSGSVCPRCDRNCSHCNSTGCTDCVRDCHACGDDVCGSCRESCSECDRVLCDNCQDNACGICGDLLCASCAIDCDCGNVVCNGCSCPCQEETENEEEASEEEVCSEESENGAIV